MFFENGKYSDSSLSWGDLYPQVLASCTSLLMVIQPGLHLAYSNNLFHHMTSFKNGQFSWITSVVALCIPIGALIIGQLMDRIGRKKACIITCLILLSSWTVATFMTSDEIYWFFAFRILAGIGGGMTTVCMIYVSEISHSSYKQLLLSLNSVFFSGGILLSTSIVQLEWNIINYTFIGLTVVNIVLIIINMPESPIWILKFKSPEHVDEAKSAMQQLYPRNKQVFEREWERLKSTSSCCVAVATGNSSFIESVRSNAAAYKPMVVLAFLLLLQQLTGAYPCISYALPVLKRVLSGREYSISEIDSLTALGAIRFAAGLLTCALSFYVGRKPLMMFSCAGMVLSSALVIVFQDFVTGPSTVPLPLCGVMLFVFSSSLGVLVFPWTMICELLSTPVRAVGGCLLVSYTYVIMFMVLKVFPHVLENLSVVGIYLFFGVTSLLMAAYVHFVVPETLGKSFHEIEAYFTKNLEKPDHM
ncbi:facilitated trehalose transporter Tret1-like isoform X2 [Sipha flava]|nr:facilitated trehalose transporter Tret1-like isoform X2 [Sipha flava]